MSQSKLEIQRMMERISRLESQVASLNFKLQAMETTIKPENLAKRVREGEAERERKSGGSISEQISTDLFTAAKPNPEKPPA